MSFRNVFVLCTGRCGSKTLAKAFRHAANYTAGHESRAFRIGAARMDYPERHIEVDNRLAFFLGRLNQRFGKAPLYIHLTRQPDDVIRSFAARENWGVMRSYRDVIVIRGRLRNPDADAQDFARDYVETTSANIEMFLGDKPNRLQLRLETLQEDFPAVWARIGATGDLDAAMLELTRKHNATEMSERPLA